MPRHFILGVCLTLVAGLIAIAQPASAAVIKGADSLTSNEVISDDAFLAGNTLNIQEAVEGELFAAGQTVSVSGMPGRSIFAAGNTVELTAGSSYNSYLAGSVVKLSGTYKHDIYVFAGDLTIAPGTIIEGELHAFANNVTLAGTIDGDATIEATTLTSDAVIGGSLTGTIRNLTFTGGSIGGDLKYTSKDEATGKALVTVGGMTQRYEPATQGQNNWNIFLDFLATLLFIAFVLLISPRRSRDAQHMLEKGWGRSLAIGAVATIAIPGITLLFFSTIIGWRVAVVMLALYVVLLMVSGVYGMFALGKQVTKSISHPFFRAQGNWPMFVTAAIGALIVAILTAVPGVAIFAMLAFWIAFAMPSVGAIVQLITDQHHK